jgi:hypothetical protein
MYLATLVAIGTALALSGGAGKTYASILAYAIVGTGAALALVRERAAARLVLWTGLLGAGAIAAHALAVSFLSTTWNPGACGGGCEEREQQADVVTDHMWHAVVLLVVAAMASAVVLLLQRPHSSKAQLPPARVL